MTQLSKTLLALLSIVSVVFLFALESEWAMAFSESEWLSTSTFYLPPDSSKNDTIDLPFPFTEDDIDPLNPVQRGLFLKDPDNVKNEVEYDPRTREYDVSSKIGDINYRNPSYMTFLEYQEYDLQRQIMKNWRERVAGETKKDKKLFQPSITVPGDAFETIFGSNTIDIRPQGSAELIFGGNIMQTKNPALPIRQQRMSAFQFQQKIQMNIVGKIGDKINLTTNYNTETGFAFDNRINLKYEGKEDEIIQLIEAGNVSMPLTGTLITGSQSLMGIKTKWKFGRLTATTIFSQQQGDRKNITVQGGAQTSTFDFSASNYEANKHFFVAQQFKDLYDQSMSTLPNVTSPFNITRMEVYITNRTYATVNVRNIAAFADLGESNPAYFNSKPSPSYTTVQPGESIFPKNQNNNLDPQVLLNVYPDFRTNTPTRLANLSIALPPVVPSVDQEYLQNARLLAATEYTFSPLLGYISLNQALNADEVLAVAFQYTVNAPTGQQVLQVGEFSTDVPGSEALVLKMLKPTVINTSKPVWDLMMKNIYSLNGFQISRDNFKLNLLYQDANTGVRMNVFPEGQNIQGKILLQVFNIDRVNNQNDPQPDGFFDFIEGKTIQSDRGRIIFPMREPFRGFLRSKFNLPQELTLANKFAFDSLYTTTQPLAQLDAFHNRYYLQGSYQSAQGSEIALNALNIPQGSVIVTAGGIPLQENVDYTVDYALGRVRIINQGLINSQTPINISTESNSQFGLQAKRLMGANFDYKFSKDFSLGATILNLTERPIIQKINIGDEPISNTIWGINGNYNTESNLITKIIDKLPFYSTKEKSNITASFETAHLIPGHSKLIGRQGLSYIDDFEGAESTIDIRNQGFWFLASTPGGQPDLFKEADLFDELAYNFNRAKLNWYTLDPLFALASQPNPNYIIGSPLQSNNFMRQVVEPEIWPNKGQANGQRRIVPSLDLYYQPTIKGPYNYDVSSGIYSSGIDLNGLLVNPKSRWGGIMRRIETTDWEAANIDYIEFWMMDPFANQNGPGSQINPGTGGDFYLNVGNMSEDILRDGQQSFEQGLPSDGSETNTATSAWGRYPTSPPLVNAFDFNPDARPNQDVGLDGLKNEEERVFFQSYLDAVAAQFGQGSAAYQRAFEDPSNDDFRFFRDDVWDNQQASIIERYTRWNGLEANSPIGGNEAFPRSSSPLPNIEDINRDNTLNTSEAYFQYKISLRQQDMIVGQNYIVDKVAGKGILTNGENINVDWYQFRVPVRSYQKKIGGIQDFRSIRFIRMFMHNFSDPAVVRFARLELVRAEWRRYLQSIKDPGIYIGNDINTQFEVSTVNIEENGDKLPVNYQVPPQIRRQVDISTTNLIQLNEQSLQLRVCGLEDGDARAIFKNTNLDIRAYRRLQMEIHSESMNGNQWADKQVTAFIRIGTDFTNNYYEYEVPLDRCADGETDPEKVWNNKFDFDLNKLIEAKIARNREMNSNPNVNINTPFYYTDSEYPDNRITVVGIPQISGVKAIMMGVKNPKNDGTLPFPDDGSSACLEVWFNELRLSEYFEQGGYAVNARVTTKLADLGTLALAGSRSTFGFGSIEKKPIDRQRSNTNTYNIITNLELGKFFPKRLNLSIPFYFEYGKSISNPQFNPLDQDVKFNQALNDLPTDFARDTLTRLSQTWQRRRAINFTNVRKNKNAGKKDRFYNVENFDLTLAFSEILLRDPYIENNVTKTYNVGLGYTFAPKAKSWEPFKNVKFLGNSKWVSLIKDFNIGLAPTRISSRSDILRNYNEQTLRNTTSVDQIVIPTTYFKSFTWNRLYDVKWNFTKSLQFDFTANNGARVDEEPGRIDTREKRDSVLKNIRNFGRTTNYQHNFNVAYQLPFSKLPITDFITSTVTYGGMFNFTAAPFVDLNQDGVFDANPFGNTISNSQSVNITGQANFVQLYNKVPYLKKVNQKKQQNQNKKPPVKKPTPPKSPQDTTKTPKPKPVKKDTTNTVFQDIIDNTAKVLMMLKNASVTYTESNGSLLPGYLKKTDFLGFDATAMSPDFAFISGQQRPDILDKAGREGWITRDVGFNTQFSRTVQTNLSYNVTIEPINQFRITITGNRTYGEAFTTIYRYNESTERFDSLSAITTGNFSVSFNSLATAFTTIDNQNHTSEIFTRMLSNRLVESENLQRDNPNSVGTNSAGYANGYGATNQDVLMRAFVNTYSSGKGNVNLNSLASSLPAPNWRINYDGLTKIPFFKKYFKSFSLGHAYRSSFNIGSFTTNLNYGVDDENNKPNQVDQSGNFFPEKNVLMASITEQFSPLINIDAAMKNNITARFEIKTNRDLSLSTQNSQITEISGREFTVGGGYVIKNVELPFTIQGLGNKKFKSDLTIRCDISIRTNKTVVRKIPNETEELLAPILSAGQRSVNIKTSADYVLNQSITVRLFFDRIGNNPFVSNQFPNSNTNFGLSLRFTLNQ